MCLSELFNCEKLDNPFLKMCVQRENMKSVVWFMGRG